MYVLTTTTLALLALAADSAQDARTDLDAAAESALGLTAAVVRVVDLSGAPGSPAIARFRVDGAEVELQLEPFALLTDDFRLVEDRGAGVLVDVPFDAPATYRGIVTGQADGDVAVTWLADGLWGRFTLADGGDWWIQPALGAVPGAAPGQHVLYRGEDVIPSGGTCGTDLLPNGGHVDGFGSTGVQPPTSGSSAGTDPPFLCELACDADFEYFQDYGSSTSVMNRITSVINTLNVQYENEVGIQHVLTTILVRTTSNDPYTSTVATTLLNEFQNEWNSNQGSIQRDGAQLFTGKRIQGSTIGIAFVSTICNTGSAYSVVESDCCGSFSCVTDLSAHELGHMWSADHCTCVGFTMNPFLTCANRFTTSQTIPKISTFRDNRQCLTGGPDPYAKFDGQPRSGDAPLTVAFSDESTGTGVATWSWDFGDGATSTQQNPTHVYTTPGTYDVTLTVTGTLGNYTRTTTDYITVTDPFLATCTDRPGGGSNPAIFTCVTTPVIGSNWVSSVDAGAVGASGLSILFGYSGAAPFPIPSAFGEILVDPLSSFFFSSFTGVLGGTATHTLAIPNDPSLEALPVYTQVFLNGVGLLTNGVDLELGK